MNLVERLIYWLEINERECVERDLINDSLEENERLRADLKNATDDREACLLFLRTELRWADFREEFFKDDASGQNAKKLVEFLRRFEKPKEGGDE